MPKQRITVCAFIHKNDRLFVPRRATTKKFLPNKFELPGGHVEFGEDLVPALKREIREEFGLEIEVGEIFYAFTYLNPVKKSHSVEIVYLTQFKDPEAKIKLNPKDHCEYRWLTLAEVKKLYDHTDQEYPAVLRGFEVLGNPD